MECRIYFIHKFFMLLCAAIFVLIGCSKQREFIPEKVSDLVLVKTITGKQAKDYINKLHFQPVTDNENIIAYYENLSGNAIVYITIYEKGNDAAKNFEKMTKKISPENSVFILPEFFEYNNQKIYKCFGMGMTHFVFVKNNSLYWISADTHLAENFFKTFYNLTE